MFGIFQNAVPFFISAQNTHSAKITLYACNLCYSHIQCPFGYEKVTNRNPLGEETMRDLGHVCASPFAVETER